MESLIELITCKKNKPAQLTAASVGDGVHVTTVHLIVELRHNQSLFLYLCFFMLA